MPVPVGWLVAGALSLQMWPPQSVSRPMGSGTSPVKRHDGKWKT